MGGEKVTMILKFYGWHKIPHLNQYCSLYTVGAKFGNAPLQIVLASVVICPVLTSASVLTENRERLLVELQYDDTFDSDSDDEE